MENFELTILRRIIKRFSTYVVCTINKIIYLKKMIYQNLYNFIQTRFITAGRAYQHVGYKSDHLVRELPAELAHHAAGGLPRPQLPRHRAHRHPASALAQDRYI